VPLTIAPVPRICPAFQDQREKRAFGQGKFYQFMMRTRQPSGLVTNRLYLVMDDLADKVRGCGAACVPPALHSVCTSVARGLWMLAVCVSGALAEGTRRGKLLG
jgi:hypothetical protein